MEEEYKQVKNTFGIYIKVCCASCRFKKFVDEKERKCALSGLAAYPKEYCTSWQMADNLISIGRGGGRVRKKKWLEYVRDHGLSDATISEFEQKFGSRFITK